MRTRKNSHSQNGARERGFGTLKFERPFFDDVNVALKLFEWAEDHRLEYNDAPLHEAIALNWPAEVQLGVAAPSIPNFEIKDYLLTT